MKPPWLLFEPVKYNTIWIKPDDENHDDCTGKEMERPVCGVKLRNRMEHHGAGIPSVSF